MIGSDEWLVQWHLAALIKYARTVCLAAALILPGRSGCKRHCKADQLIRVPCHPSLFAGVWEGQFFLPGGAGAFLLSADALAGSGDVAGLLGEQEVRWTQVMYHFVPAPGCGPAAEALWAATLSCPPKPRLRQHARIHTTPSCCSPAPLSSWR